MAKRPKARRPPHRQRRSTRSRPRKPVPRATHRRVSKKKVAAKRRSRAKRVRAPRTVSQFFKLSAFTRDKWKRLWQVLADVRKGKPEAQALADAGLTREVVHTWAPSAFRQMPSGRRIVRPNDTVFRVAYLPDPGQPDGKRPVAPADFRQAQIISEYWHAVRRWVRYGDAQALLAFQGVSVNTANGKKVALLTDRSTLRRLALAGVLSFESIYPK